jgi:flagellar biosynthetic protein FliP
MSALLKEGWRLKAGGLAQKCTLHSAPERSRKVSLPTRIASSFSGRRPKSEDRTPRLRRFALVVALLALFAPLVASAAPGMQAVTVSTGPGGQTYSLTLQVLALMTAVTLLPAILLMMTSFTRIVIVLALLRQAIGAGNSPPNQALVGLALFLSLFIMGPVIDKINSDAVQPYMAGSIDAMAAVDKGLVPLKEFMLNQTRESDIATFVRISGGTGFATPQDVPLRILVPAFATSELKSAFQIGFLIFIPFVIIDLVVASVLMSMGMMMLSPMLISLPFKIMLFVLVDGWSLIMSTLAASFYR